MFQRFSVKKGVLRNFEKFIGVRDSLLANANVLNAFNKVSGLSLQFYLKRDSLTGVSLGILRMFAKGSVILRSLLLMKMLFIKKLMYLFFDVKEIISLYLTYLT